MDDHEPLPRRLYGTHLPAVAYKAVGIARVPIKNVTDQRFRNDDQALRVILNGLRRWNP